MTHRGSQGVVFCQVVTNLRHLAIDRFNLLLEFRMGLQLVQGGVKSLKLGLELGFFLVNFRLTPQGIVQLGLLDFRPTPAIDISAC